MADDYEPNALGIAGSVVWGFTGLDAYKDIGDIAYGIYNWEWTWSHAGMMAFNLVSLAPVIGAAKNLKYADEVLDTVENTADTVKLVNKCDAPNRAARLPDLPDGYHYRNVGGQTQVVRNPNRGADLPQMHLENGQLMLGPSPSIARSTATRNAFLRSLADNPNVPKHMRPYLQRGELPPGYTVHHKKALFDGGTDTIDNMVLQGVDLHTNTHRFYRPGGRIPSINPRPGTFQSN